jgi:tetratricopeptide (TPR) repeat protein
LRKQKNLLIALVICGLVIWWSQRNINAHFKWFFPPVNEMLVTENYAADISAVMMGSRRMAGNLAYIQMLQYYGTAYGGGHVHGDSFFPDIEQKVLHERYDPVPGPPPDSEEGGIDHKIQKCDQDHMSGPHQDHVHRHDHTTEGIYPRLKTLGRRIMLLDPFFNAGILEVAGALAYNQMRKEEALELLEEARQRDPYYFRYGLYIGAILYKDEGDNLKFIKNLKEAIKYPECPTILEQILGNVLRKHGRYEEAADVFIHIIETAAHEYDRRDASRKLNEMVTEHPELQQRFSFFQGSL